MAFAVIASGFPVGLDFAIFQPVPLMYIDRLISMFKPISKKRRIRRWILVFLFVGIIGGLSATGQCSEPVASWDFTQGNQSWTANRLVTNVSHSIDGWSMNVQGPDPYLTSPPVDCPADQFLVLSLRMRSTASAVGAVYFGKEFSEQDSRQFVVDNDGQWHVYRISLPAQGFGVRFRLDPSHMDGMVSVAWVRIEAFAEYPSEPWASPHEVRFKKSIGGGLYTTHGEDTAITPRFLATHPEFVESYPFDGIVLPALLSKEWVASLGLKKKTPTGEIPWEPLLLHHFLWNTISIPDEAVAQTISDLNTMRRGSLTDNFLIYGMLEGSRGRDIPDLTDDHDWSIIENNARLAARICRKGKLKGFWLDTEQYTFYRWRAESGPLEMDPEKSKDLHFPLGKDKDNPELLRRRGAQWIKAVQAEFPEIKIMTTFAWSEDSISYGPLMGVIPFLDGVLAGIESPGQIIHGHENTFYFGHAAGTVHAPTGFLGDRSRYAWARSAIRGWRALSNNPARYDSFVRVGMAAWVEDHPWGAPPGTAIGTKQTLWSNLPLALAYSDEYVWVWSEFSHYGKNSPPLINPFLASLNNQTFNTGAEAAATFHEDFAADPLLRGWYFDFDMLAIGRKTTPEQQAPAMSTDTLPYVWNQQAQVLMVKGDNPSRLDGQRRRFVRPLMADAMRTGFQMAIDFRVESFGSDDHNPMVLGLFNNGLPLKEFSMALQIASPEKITLEIVSNGTSLTRPMTIPGGMKVGQTYQWALHYSSATRSLQSTLTAMARHAVPSAEVSYLLPASMGPIAADELGIAIYETSPSKVMTDEPYRYSVQKVIFNP